MRRHKHLAPAFAMVLLKALPRFPHPQLRALVVRRNNTAGKHHTVPAFYRRIRYGVMIGIHLVETDDPRRRKLAQCGKRRPIHHFVIQLVFRREYPLKKPFIQRQVVRVSAQYGHGNVRMQVKKTGHHNVAVRFNFPLHGKHRRIRRRANIGDPPIFYMYLRIVEHVIICIVGDHRRIADFYIHDYSPYKYFLCSSVKTSTSPPIARSLRTATL